MSESKEAKQWLDNNELSYTIWNNKYRFNNESFDQWLTRVSGNNSYIRDLIYSKKFLFAGRTLSNRGTTRGSLNNCYSIGYVPDSLSDILDVNTKIGLTYKAQGGQGLSLSKIRPKGASIKGLYQSDGIIPFMELFNTTTSSISQGGSRKGALMMSLDVWHKEILDFVTIKSDLGKINKANLSVEIDDYFMEIIEHFITTGEEKIVTIIKEFEGSKIEYQMNPVQVYKQICITATNSAEPGIIFTNRFRNYNIMEFVDHYEIETSNPCQPSWATVLTPSGISTIGELNVGDKIWSSEGWTTVINKWSTGIKDVYEYRTKSGSFIGTENHKVVSNGVKIEVKDAKSIDYLSTDEHNGDITSYTEEIISIQYRSTERVFDITVDNSTHTYWTGGLNVSNCGEQPLKKNACCALSSINISEYIVNSYSEDWLLDYSTLNNDIYQIILAMDSMIDENLPNHALQEQADVAKNYRNIGVGLMGIADMFVKTNITYGSQQSLDLIHELGRFIFRSAVQASSLIAVEKGSFPMYEDKVFESTIIKNHFTDSEIEILKQQGLRNCSLLSIAPTGSIGTMLNVSTGSEPYFALSYNRKTESLNNKDTFYKVYVKEADYYLKNINSTLSKHFVSSTDINYIDRINLQAALQDHIDTAISSTINLPKDTHSDEVFKLYYHAWKQGLKGVTIYVDGSRDAILSVGEQTIKSTTDVAKRPKELVADYHQVKVKGEQFIVLVGLYEGRPYEIFTFRPTNPVNIRSHQGTLTKIKKMHYKFESEFINISNLELNSDNIEEKAATLYASMLLRHNADIEYIIKTSKKVNENITSFSSAMCRILNIYNTNSKIKESCDECGGEMIRNGGCIECSQCGTSKCG